MEWLVALHATLWSEEGAGWAQFTASLLALWIAISAPIWHSKIQARHAAATQIGIILAIVQYVVPILEQIGLLDLDEVDARRKAADPVHRLAMTEVIGGLERFPIEMLQDDRLAAPMLTLRHLLELLREALIRLENYHDAGGLDTPVKLCNAIRSSTAAALKSISTMRRVGLEYGR